MSLRIAAAYLAVVATVAAADLPTFDYRLLSRQNVHAMEQAMNEAAADGYAYRALLPGDDRELLVVMEKAVGGEVSIRATYKLLSTSRKVTMERELQEAGEAGFRLLEVTVAVTSFWGGDELVCILGKEE
jgi:hypothetical protein